MILVTIWRCTWSAGGICQIAVSPGYILAHRCMISSAIPTWVMTSRCTWAVLFHALLHFPATHHHQSLMAMATLQLTLDLQPPCQHLTVAKSQVVVATDTDPTLMMRTTATMASQQIMSGVQNRRMGQTTTSWRR